MNTLRWYFIAVDVGFVVYWTITALHLIPAHLLFKDYHEPLMVTWNWSFMPLDLFISATGFMSLYRWKKDDLRWRSTAIVSLALTTASGLQAIAFWSAAGDFDPTWWAPNLFLAIYPWVFIFNLVNKKA